MLRLAVLAIIIAVVFALSSKSASGAGESPGGNILAFEMTLNDGTKKALSDFKGQVLVLVNVASKCGFTGQYEDLQKLQKKYEKQGFNVLAFPANNFLGQEPGTNAEIIEFCRTSYGVTFPVFAKISVAGNDIHPLYKFLTDESTNPGYSGKISWNFNKFIVNRKGEVIARFGSRTSPSDPEFVSVVEKALKEIL
jgi:glutathione peroxidase